VTVREGQSHGGRAAWRRTGLLVAGAGLLAATAGIHLDLYLTGYDTIPTIGWLFLLQVIAGLVLAAAAVVTRSRLVAAAAAGFALSTLGGYLLSVWVGLFGFKEVRTTAGIVAGVIEVAAFAVLALAALLPATEGQATSAFDGIDRALTGVLTRVRATGSRAALGITAASMLAFALLGVAVANAAGRPAAAAASGTVMLKTATIGGVPVVTNAEGKTLYWFVPDTASSSKCYAQCASYWPPVIGRPKAGAGVTGTLGTITRTNGQVQATYDGHPLYTYVGDTAPGQAHGNNITLNGGLWHEVRVSG
jgi:predicted lipoprotein with Yx(FWY)xxD motif